MSRASGLSTLRKFSSLRALESALARARNPYAFGLVEKGYHLGVPKSPDGCRSGLAVEWLSKRLLAGLRPDEMSYTPDVSLAAKRAKAAKSAAVLVKPCSVAQVHRAAAAVGLLPQKSTYFFPKIATGLAFRPLAP